MKINKLILFLFSALILIGSTQCKKESTSPTIIGKWKMISESYKVYKNNVLTSSGTEDINLVGGTIQFNSDQTAIATDKSGTYNYKYSINNTSLIIDGSNYTIVELTTSKLVISYENDLTSTSKEVITDTFSKVN